MAVSQKDIARILGVTQATVSMALRNHPGISDEVKRSVWELRDSLGYSPNHSAVSLATRSTKVISVVTPAITYAGEGFLRFLGFLQQETSRRGYMYRLDGAQELEVVVAGRSADGVIITDISEGYEKSMAHVKHMPLIYGGGISRPLRDNSVPMDNFGGSVKAVTHLHGLGHRRLAFFGLVEDAPICMERWDGYVETVNSRDLPASAEYVSIHGWFEEPAQVEAYEDELKDLIRKGVTAILVSHDLAAVGVMRILDRLGVRVPDDLSIVSFDDSIIARAWLPPLTVVRLDIQGAAAATIDQLLAIIRSAGTITGRLIGTELIVRGTTSRPAFDAPAIS